MIDFKKETLENGLTVIANYDEQATVAAMNLVYNVGAKHELESKTGFAHLFEHLMFEGSKHIPSYDGPLQQAGGQNNAFTSNDITNYYLTVPTMNLDVGFWLESDRMLELDFSPKKLDIQKSVVIEEFNQRYLNQPYGDVWLLLRPLAYQTHPYKWPTIGKNIEHIESATLEDVKSFFYTHYAPNNAVLSISGNVDPDRVFSLAEKWFGPIPLRSRELKALPREQPQKSIREETVYRDVPMDALYMAFHMPGKLEKGFYEADTLTDILAQGKSSRFFNRLVREKKSFIQIDAFITGSTDPGLLVICGNPAPGVTMEQAQNDVWEELNLLKEEPVSARELEKVRNKQESAHLFGEVSALNKAMQLGMFQVLGNCAWINDELKKYKAFSAEDLRNVAQSIFQPENCTILNYLKKEN